MLFLACRNNLKANKAVMEIKNLTGNSNIESLEMDLGSFQSIREAVKCIKDRNIKIDFLINNAGRKILLSFHFF